jgi:hypothetical protein
VAAPPPSDALNRHFAFNQRALDTLKPPACGLVEYYDTKMPGLALLCPTHRQEDLLLNYRLPNQRKSARWGLGAFPVPQWIRHAKVENWRIPSIVTASIRISTMPKRLRPLSRRVSFGSRPSRNSSWSNTPNAKKKSWRQNQGWINLYLLPAWKDIPVGEIRRRHVAELLNKITHERDGPRSSDVVR